ncbi:MAG: DUF5689 domain-containing protein [Prevotella sp.]|nr:DUF5689 domain-containing protein [Prevotella sp.]
METMINKKLRRLKGWFFILPTLLFMTALTACQKDWDDPVNVPYGNNSISEDNVVTIAQLKAMYPNVFASTDANKQITEDIKIRGRVTGNDIGSNLYKQFALQDETGAVIVAVNQSGLSGFLALGQEIIIDLKNLYIGGYRKQPELGQPYNGSSIGRMSKDIFQRHFRIVGTPEPSKIAPIEFDEKMNKDENCGKLVIIRNVTFTDANGTNTFAPGDGSATVVGGCVNRNIKINDEKSNVVIRTSTYARFAAIPLPYDVVNKKPKKCNITGIATRYASGSNDTWQILIRQESDIEVIE